MSYSVVVSSLLMTEIRLQVYKYGDRNCRSYWAIRVWAKKMECAFAKMAKASICINAMNEVECPLFL
jgi:hypothetical protein